MCIPTVYDESLDPSGLTAGVAQFEFSDLKPAHGDVVLTYFHRNDTSDSYYDLKVGQSFSKGESGPNSAVCGTYVATVTTISKDDFNNRHLESSSLRASMHYDNLGGVNSCRNSKEVYVSLKYEEVGC
jgi:hypothetical protein